MPPKSPKKTEKAPKSPKKLSKAVSASYLDDGNSINLHVAGRPPGLFNKGSQGDHVTAYSLIERGLERVLSNISKESGGDVGLEIRNQMRVKRGALFDYLTTIAVLNPSPKEYEVCFSEIDNYVVEFNEKRNLKSTIRSQYEEAVAAAGGVRVREPIAAAIKGDSIRKFAENFGHYRDLFSKISRYLLTYFNKTPLTSFYKLGPGYKNEGEGAAIKSSLGALETLMTSPLQDKHLPEIIKSAINLIYYPEIVSVVLEIEEGKKKVTKTYTAKDIMSRNAEVVTNFGKKEISAPRTNDRGVLCQLLARHIFILTSAYPEISKKFDKKLLIDSFVEGFIAQGENGWPNIAASEELMNEVKSGVNTQLDELVKKKAKDQYKQRVIVRFSYKQGEDGILYSSDEEELPDIPAEAPAASVTPLDHDQLTELEELRELRDAIRKGLKSGDVKIKNPKLLAVIESSTGR